MTPDEERRRLGRGIPPSWASAWGVDDFGVFASVRVGTAEQRMRWIGPGHFMMGTSESETGRWEDEGPMHRVELTQGYWMADTPCTQAMWEAVMGENPSYFKGSAQLPVETVSWDDIVKFLAAFNTRVPGFEARLPSEAEWEFACRAGTTTARYGELDEIAWHAANSGRTTHEVGLLKPNQWGIHDMLGNVNEWCSDGWSFHEARTAIDPHTLDGPRRVVHGGGWYDDGQDVRAAYRLAYDSVNRLHYLGFRLARGQRLR